MPTPSVAPVIARAPTRICLVGGGTDVNPYADQEGGAIINVAIDKRHRVCLFPRQDDRLFFGAMGEVRELRAADKLDYGEDRRFDLLRAIHNHFREALPSSYALVVSGDVADGCGLGTSGSVGVTVIGALARWLRLDMGRDEIARLAFELETEELGWAGGKQDQWAAAFGGLCFTTYGPGDAVEVHPLRCSAEQVERLQEWLLLVHVGGQRTSSNLQVSLQEGMRESAGDGSSRRDALDELKALALEARPLLEQGRIAELGGVVHRGWEAKKRSNPVATTPRIDAIYAAARAAGALGGKLIGAGGAGYLYLLCPPHARDAVLVAAGQQAAAAVDFEFDTTGLLVES